MSDEDIKLANDTDMIYLIYSMADDEVKAFGITGSKEIREVKLTIV